MRRFGSEELKMVKRVFTAGQFSPYINNPRGGPMVREFEKTLADYVGVKHAIAVANGTAALHGALLACEVGAGNLVATSPYTFIASATSILMAGAAPVFVDVNRRTYNIDPPSLERVPGKTSAVVAVDLLGNPSQMDEIVRAAKREEMIVIEDAAQALGAELRGRKAGALGDVSCFSFQETKIITTGGEGGAILTDDDRLADRCLNLRSHGSQYSEAPYLTFNFRMTELQAAFGLAQMRKLDRFLRINRRNAEYILRNLPEGISPPYVHEGANPAFWIIGCLYDQEVVGIPRKEFVDRLTDSGVNMGRVGRTVGLGYTKLLYQRPVLAKYKRRCPNAEELLDKTVWFDIHRWRDLDDIKSDVEKIHEAVGR